MLTIILGLVVGLAAIYYRISSFKRKNAPVEVLVTNNKFECLDHSKSWLLCLAVATLLPLACLAYFIINYDESMVAIMTAFSLMFIAEIINARQSLKFYYHKSACIINEKLVNYKSLKTIYRKTTGRYLLVTFNNEHYSLAKLPAQKVMELSGLKLSQ